MLKASKIIANAYRELFSGWLLVITILLLFGILGDLKTVYEYLLEDRELAIGSRGFYWFLTFCAMFLIKLYASYTYICLMKSAKVLIPFVILVNILNKAYWSFEFNDYSMIDMIIDSLHILFGIWLIWYFQKRKETNVTFVN